MNILDASKRAQILHALIEGLGVNSTARLVGCSKVTVLRLLMDAGTFCRDFHDQHVRRLDTRQLQLDEVWGFVGCKVRAKQRGAKGHGDSWCWVAIDADSRLVVAYHVGARENADAHAFLVDVARRLNNRVQISSDALTIYQHVIRRVFGDLNTDYGILVKHYATGSELEARSAAGRYQPSLVTNVSRTASIGFPDEDRVSTSYVERSHLELRTHNRRFVRLGLGFSKRLANHEAAIALHYWAHNFVRKNATLKTTPAVVAGLASKAVTPIDLVEMIEAEEQRRGGRITSYLPSAGAIGA